MRNLSKKVLAVLLSALMVFTALPFTALANAATDAEALQLKTAMEAYEGEMDGTIHTNMLPAYNAYIDANEAYDAYLYGAGTTAQLTAAKTALEAATAAMQVWTVPVFDAKAYHEGNEAKNAYSNVVYCTTTTNWSGTNGYNNSYTTIGSQKVKIAMPTNIVFVYDGKGDIYGPVLFEHTRDGNHNTNTKWVGADDSNWEFRDYWYGYYDSNNQNYQMWPGEAKTAGMNDSYFGYSEATYQENVTSNITSSRFYWNKLYFKGTPDTTNYYTKTYRQTFTMVGWQNNTFNSGNKTGTIYADNTQYVINYAPALTHLTSSDATSAKSKFTALVDSDGTIPVENYTLGGLTDLLTAMDGLTGSCPKNYDYSNTETAVTTCAADIKTAVEKADSATATPDGAGYTALRAAIRQAKQIYADGNDDDFYNATLWTTFANAYTDATDNMTNLPSNGYSPSAAAQTLADRLNTGYANLIASVQNVDTTALETAIDDAEYAIANSSYWTSGSFANADLQTVIDTAKVAVWTSVDKYKSVRAKSQTTETTVEEQFTAVKTALLKLVIDKNATSVSTGGYSANSVVAYATNTDNFTPADYANWVTVETAVAAAQNYDPVMGTYADNCATQKIKSYQVVIRNVITALKNLKDAFSKMQNGELIAQGTLQDVVTAVGKPDSTGAGEDFKTYFWGYSDSVVFRTSHSAAYLPLPDSYISVWTQSGYPVGLDAIHIDDPCEYANSNGNGQITSGGNETNQAVSSDTINTYSIGGGLAAVNDGTNAKEGRFVLGSDTLGTASTPAGSGIFVNHSHVWPITNNVYAIEANGTMHNTAESVSDDDYFTYDLTTILREFDNIDNHRNDANYGAFGTVWADNNNTTEMKATTSLYVTSEASNKLTKNTKLSIDEYSFSNKRFGAVLWWKYMNINTFGYTYHGYRHDWTNYSRSVKVVNIADLFRLIDECENAGYVANEYTNASWSTYVNALAAAKADMDYSDKTAEWVLEQCQGRYDDLFDARSKLIKAADRTALIAARDAVKDIHDAGKTSSAFGGPWSDESWEAFDTYYMNEVAAYLNGIYSATGVRDFAYYATGSTTIKSDAQQDIETRAARIVELKDALQSSADFTPLDNAVASLRTKVENGQFTTDSIQAVEAELQAINYLWLSDAERKAVYASAEADAAIATAAAAVNTASAHLVAADDDVVNNAADIAGAARTMLQNLDKDPDVYDYEAVQGMINSLQATTAGVFLIQNNPYYSNLSTTGYNYQHLSEVESLVSDALSANFKTYTVTITGIDDAASMHYTYTVGGTEIEADGASLANIPYGTSVKFTVPNNQYVNWYYTYASATSANDREKYLTNDKEINFVVKGDITFRLDNETDTTDTTKFKVTYASGLHATAYKVEYVSAGDLALPEAPTFAGYTFANYTVNGANKNVGDTVSITKNTVIIANYTCDNEEGIRIYIANLGGSIDGMVSFDTSYNEKIELSYTGLSTAVQRGTGSVRINDEQVNLAPTAANKNKTYNEGSIYAFTVICGDLTVPDSNDEAEIERIIETRDEGSYDTPDAQLLGAETVLAYGDTYTFYASENMVIIPYTQAQFEAAKTKGFLNTDTMDARGADAFASESIINAGTKLSIVSNYILPAGCELVEAGLLMKATKDGTVPTNDLTFKTVGTNGVVRMKSSQHTVGGQFVISPIQVTTAIKGKTINAKYAAYVIYTDADGAQHSVISAPQTASVIA